MCWDLNQSVSVSKPKFTFQWTGVLVKKYLIPAPFVAKALHPYFIYTYEYLLVIFAFGITMWYILSVCCQTINLSPPDSQHNYLLRKTECSEITLHFYFVPAQVIRSVALLFNKSFTLRRARFLLSSGSLFVRLSSFTAFQPLRWIKSSALWL